MKGAATYLICILGLLAAFAFAAYTWLPDAALTSDVTRIVQASVTAVAIAAGGVFAAVKLQVFRDFAPHVTITQAVSHRLIGDSYVHLLLTSTLRNSSKVKVEFRRGYFRLQQISPVTDEEVELLYADVFVDRNYRDIQWPTSNVVSRSWHKDELIIEPGEIRQETCEFIVSAEVKSVLIETFFYNLRRPPVPEGWGAVTVYDIMSDSQ